MLKAPPRRIASAIDLLEQDYNSVVGGVRFTELPLNQIQPYHDHRFRPYKGERLEDMVESVKVHGVLNPVIVQKLNADHYEMLAGHNRLRAAELVGLKTIPALVKENLTEEEALAYVIETNLMQRSFTDMLPSEQAAVLAVRHEKLSCQGRRNDIIRELQLLETGEVPTSSPVGTKLGSLAQTGQDYGLGRTSVARLLRLNYLIDDFRQMVDKGTLALRVADDLSFLSEQEQRWICEAAQELHFKLTMNSVKLFRNSTAPLSKDMVWGLMQGTQADTRPKTAARKVRISKSVYDEFFKERTEDEIQSVIDQALKAWFAAGNS